MENMEENYLKIIERLNELEKSEKETQEVLKKILIEMEKKEKNSSKGSLKEEKKITNSEDDELDDFFIDAAEAVINVGAASTSFIQRKFRIGYARSSRILDQLEAEGIISGYLGPRPREVFMTKEEFEELKKTKYSNLIKN